MLPTDVQRVYIPRVENATTETSLTSMVTEALRDRFERYGVLTVVEEIGGADAVLNVQVKDLKRDTKSVTSGTDTALQYVAVITLSGELSRVTGGVLWRNPRIRVAKAYGLTSDVVVTSSADFASGSLGSGDLGALGEREVSRGQEQETFLELSDEVAKKIYESAVLPDF
ncbi:MAG: hypothetical protein KDD53_08945 [Bdellovibrionales bacterium]|nr:hypothetical protein [Bdellovibrionales bacterium]